MINKDNSYEDYRFLIVDDRPFVRGLIQVMLNRCLARNVMHAMDGGSASGVLAAASGNVDCVICDWNMEPIDGLALLRSIRCGDVPHTPRNLLFIMLTGYADEHIVKAALALDVDGYLVKPVSFNKLVSVIDAVFAKEPVLKSKDAYRSQGIIELPGAPHASAKDIRIPPWVVLSKLRQENKLAAARSLERIQHEGKGQLKRRVIHRETLDLDRISAGKILAEDIFTEQGTLLLAAGTLLTDSLLARLRELAAVSSDAIQLVVGDYDE